MSRNQQIVILAIAAIIGIGLFAGAYIKKHPDAFKGGGKPQVETAQPQPGKSSPLPAYTGAPPAPRGDYNPEQNKAAEEVTSQFRLLGAAIGAAVSRRKLKMENFEKLSFGGAAEAVDPAHAVFNPGGLVRFKPMFNKWLTQEDMDKVTARKNVQVLYSLRRMQDKDGTLDALYAVIHSPSDKFCQSTRRVMETKSPLKFAPDNSQAVTDPPGTIDKSLLMKKPLLPACLLSPDGRMYWVYPLRVRYMRAKSNTWQSY